jgi:ABC-2 type transport system permease protein
VRVGELMHALIRNEVLKILLKKKMVLILTLLILFISLFSYGQKYVYEQNLSRLEASTSSAGYDWKSLAKQQIGDLERRLNSPYIDEEGINSINIEIEQLNYFIENDINPVTPTAARFTVEFIDQAIIMFIPLLIIILAADIVSGELSNRTIKVLLTRAIPRWKILFSKLMALMIMSTLVVLLVAIISTLISGMFFGRWGFNEPVTTGFRLVNGSLNSSYVRTVSRVSYMILVYSLTWFVSVVIASITLMISVLVQNTASAIGIVMSTLIGGQFLQFFLSDWVLVKYFFVSNLSLTKYLTGNYQQIEGMSLIFSVIVLGVWAAVSLAVGFYVFLKKDILV